MARHRSHSGTRDNEDRGRFSTRRKTEVGGIHGDARSAGGAATGVTKYYDAFGRHGAVRQAPDAPGQYSTAMAYLLADQLGTTTMVLDATGAVVADQRYWPYGAARSSTSITQTDKLYTGQRQEPGDPAALGLYDCHARFYSTTLGRFVSADSRARNGTDIYGYVTDNPLRFTDPTGHALTDTGPGGGCGGDLACAEIAAWNAFHPGECWGGCPVLPPAPATPAEVDPGLALLVASGLTSQEKVQAARRALSRPWRQLRAQAAQRRRPT